MRSSNTEDEMKPTQIAVVIPTRDRAGLLERCLRSLKLARSVLPVGVVVEIVVVDDGSTDGTPELLSEATRSGLIDRALRNEVSRGPAQARNRGWRSTHAEIVAFTDDDCLVHEEWLHALVLGLQRADPYVAAVGGRVLPAAPGPVADYMTLHRILEPPESLAYVVTANCAFRRSALDAAGGFDERVRLAGGEDPGLCLALRPLGYRFEHHESAIVHHRYREGLWEFLRTFYRYGKGCRIVMDS